MKFPFAVAKNLSRKQVEQWEKYYKTSSEHDLKIEEGVWRRTQSFRNRKESGWKSRSDCRRRMLHYWHSYDLDSEKGKRNIVLKGSFVYINYCLPANEIQNYIESILKEIGNNWLDLKIKTSGKAFKGHYVLGDLHLVIDIYDEHPEDILAKRKFPKDYNSMDVTFYSDGFEIGEEFHKKPWNILKTGFRTKDKRSGVRPEKNLDRIVDLFPAQVELGCGPSIEAGIPPLNFLHDVYSVMNSKSNTSILCFDEDVFLRAMIENPEKVFSKMTSIFKCCFEAQPTKFYYILKSLARENLIVGNIITNNFDGLPTKMGLKEKYVRRYESDHIIPVIEFHPLAKSLIVVGSHADRRKIHQAARKKDLSLCTLILKDIKKKELLKRIQSKMF